jgi:hypothetical protein
LLVRLFLCGIKGAQSLHHLAHFVVVGLGLAIAVVVIRPGAIGEGVAGLEFVCVEFEQLGGAEQERSG